MPQPLELEFLPVVKAYPNLSRRYGEVSCVAGIDLKEKVWKRLYPIPFRTLESTSKFKKYQPIRAMAQRPSNDLRPESWRVDIDSLQITAPQITSAHGWRDRRPIVEPLINGTMCGLQRQQREDGTSLRMIRVSEVEELEIEEAETDPEKGQRADEWARQGSLLDSSDQAEQRTALEQIPYRFLYRYRCEDAKCKGHRQSIVDWEIAQLFRRVRRYEDWQDQIRNKWLTEMCGEGKETALIVGNQHQAPVAFIVLGVWWPPVEDREQNGQLPLSNGFDM